MNTLLRQIRHDLWEQRHLLLLWTGLNALHVFPLPRLAELENDGPHAFLLLLPARLLIWLLLLLRLVFLDAPVSDRAPWRTRPIGGSTMGAAKLVAAVGLTVLPLLGLHLLNQVRFGGDGVEAALAWIAPIGFWTAATLLGLFAASLCRSAAQFLLSAATLLGVAIALLTAGLNVMRPWLMQPEVPRPVLAGLLAVLALLAGSLFIGQYRRVRRAVHAATWGAVYLGGAVVAAYWPLPSAPSPTLPPGMSVRLHEVAALRQTEQGVRLQGRIAVEGRPDGTLWGFHLKTPPGVRAGQSIRPFAPVYPRDEFARQHGLPTEVQPVLRYSEHPDELVFVTGNSAVRRRGEPTPTTVDFIREVEWRPLAPEPVASFDLAHAPARSSGFQLTVITPEVTKASGNTPSALLTTPRHVRALDWLVVLTDNEGRAHLDIVSLVRRVRSYSVLQVPLPPDLAVVRLQLFALHPGPAGRVPVRAEGIPVETQDDSSGRP